MLAVVYKYPIGLGTNSIETFKGAEVLSCGFDPNGTICIWVKVDPTAPAANIIVDCIGTGWDMPDDEAKFIGTFVDGPYIWHVFWRNE